MKIYVASSWRNERQDEIVKILREAGHEVYDFKNPSETYKGFAWSDVDPDWEQWTTKQYAEALKHPVAMRGFNNDFEAMHWADACVLVLPCGRSAHTEAGWMAGRRKPVFVLQETKEGPELMYNIFSSIVDSVDSLLSKLDDYKDVVIQGNDYLQTDYPTLMAFSSHAINKAISELSYILEERDRRSLVNTQS